MRRFLIPILAAGFVLGVSQRVAAADEPKDIVAKAIKAYGGEEKLAKLNASRTKSKGKIEEFGGITLESETLLQMPDKFKEVRTMQIAGNKVTITIGYDGKKLWLQLPNETRELEEKHVKELREALYLEKVTTLVALKGKEFDLSPLGEVKVNGKEAVGVKVASKGHRDVNLYFDKTTGLLAKVARRAFDPESGKEFNEERFETDYRVVDGIQTARKVVVHRDGKKFADMEIEEIKFLDKIDDSEFAKP